MDLAVYKGPLGGKESINISIEPYTTLFLAAT